MEHPVQAASSRWQTPVKTQGDPITQLNGKPSANSWRDPCVSNRFKHYRQRKAGKLH